MVLRRAVLSSELSLRLVPQSCSSIHFSEWWKWVPKVCVAEAASAGGWLLLSLCRTDGGCCREFCERHLSPKCHTTLSSSYPILQRESSRLQERAANQKRIKSLIQITQRERETPTTRTKKTSST
ncbi:uncharacterized protein LOC122262715 [Penaeus japonicus]|uniref:uncharacterized protein LOC122262715 n=1 Tax=Penaeus japonicus TaxID=27405 RepID=UPI001C714488|nr:uncharacterized protein LOC122262715 [Penaeus japonicus]